MCWFRSVEEGERMKGTTCGKIRGMHPAAGGGLGWSRVVEAGRERGGGERQCFHTKYRVAI